MARRAHGLSVASLFCGIGGLDLGFHSAGFDVVWAADSSENAIASYNRNFETAVGRVADLAVTSMNDIPKADVLIGGPPCQSFSLVGNRDPEDPRGRLVFRFLEAVQNVRPSGFVMENVPGLAASRIDGRRLTDILADEFAGLGYHVRVMKLCATDYLVPQRRKRFFIAGAVRRQPGIPDPELFADSCYGLKSSEFDISVRAAISDLGECVTSGELAEYSDEVPSAFAGLMRRFGRERVSLHECPRMSATDSALVQHIPPGGNYMDVPDEIATGRIKRFKRTGGRTTTYGRLHPDEPAYTINTYFRRPNVGCNFHYAAQRLITPREAMRFQALPDHWEINAGAQDERNSFIGNAVPSIMAQAVAWSLAGAITGQSAVQRQLHMNLPSAPSGP